ncbi:hypothetical protein [Tenggerimyces flavus]|uniref:Uncharacterized protein n=1 Tax=Tenggerimyces flavus TaxID=1708749 RepID=A0ABV7YAG4_9ACTN|nr:hypothetical protein [Tenggerimyces flavus]MBM7788983.1 hypothetical protein [Tenggerimyces flavus]
MSNAARRASVPLTERDVADLKVLRDRESAWQQLLREHLGVSEFNSDAAILHAVLTLGLERLRDEALAKGYAKLAASYESADEREYVAALRRRTRRHHLDRDET